MLPTSASSSIAASRSKGKMRAVATTTRARRARRIAAASPAQTYTASVWASSSHASASFAEAAMRLPITVIVRSPPASTNVTPRRCGSARVAASTRTCSRGSSSRARRPRSSLPTAVYSVQAPASSASCPAETPPPPAGSSHASSARTISPDRGRRSTRTKSTHSMCPRTAVRMAQLCPNSSQRSTVAGKTAAALADPASEGATRC